MVNWKVFQQLPSKEMIFSTFLPSRPQAAALAFCVFPFPRHIIFNQSYALHKREKAKLNKHTQTNGKQNQYNSVKKHNSKWLSCAHTDIFVNNGNNKNDEKSIVSRIYCISSVCHSLEWIFRSRPWRFVTNDDFERAAALNFTQEIFHFSLIFLLIFFLESITVVESIAV